MKHILFCGDQLTVERARNSQNARINSDTTDEALLGLYPAIADWHAEANFLQVNRKLIDYACIRIYNAVCNNLVINKPVVTNCHAVDPLIR